MMRTGPPPPEDLTQQADEEEEERLKRAAEAVDAAEDKMGIFFFWDAAEDEIGDYCTPPNVTNVLST